MKKRLDKSILSTLMVFMTSTMIALADNTEESIMTSSQFLETSNSKGEIRLNQDIKISDSLDIAGKKYIIDLNGNTLTFTQPDNDFVNNADITFKNGSINLDGITGTANSILGVGDYSSSSKLTLNRVNLEAKGYSSPYALIYVYDNSILNINNRSILNIADEGNQQGGVIKTENKSGKI